MLKLPKILQDNYNYNFKTKAFLLHHLFISCSKKIKINLIKNLKVIAPRLKIK